MPPGTEHAIESAAATGRWEAVALVVVMLAVTGFLVYLVKHVMQQASIREERLGKRIDELETFIHESLLKALKDSTQAMLTTANSASETSLVVARLIDALNTTRPCFWTGEQQQQMIQTVADRIKEKVEQ